MEEGFDVEITKSQLYFVLKIAVLRNFQTIKYQTKPHADEHNWFLQAFYHRF